MFSTNSNENMVMLTIGKYIECKGHEYITIDHTTTRMPHFLCLNYSWLKYTEHFCLSSNTARMHLDIQIVQKFVAGLKNRSFTVAIWYSYLQRA